MQRVSFVGLFVALGTLSCSDPAPPVAEVSAHYTISGTCPLAPSAGGIGATTPLTEGGPTGVPDLPSGGNSPKKKGGPVIDGEEGPDPEGDPYEVSCTISGDGELSLRAELSGQNVSPFAPNHKFTSISLGGTLKSDGTGTGTVSLFTAELQGVNGENCTFQAVPTSAGTPDMGPGHAFFTFSCPGVYMNSTVQDGCSSIGTLVLDGCELR